MDSQASGPRPSGSRPAGPRSDSAAPGRWLMLALLGVAQLMLILDVTVVAIALPHMGEDLGLTRTSLTWVVSAYTLAFGGFLLLGGRSADLFGSRAVVIAGLSLFTVASLVTGLAGNAGVLLGGRVAQGLGAALLSPAALSLVVKLFDGEERNKALGIWSALGGAGAALGVLLGGVLTAGPGWPWAFYINVPIGVLVLVVLARGPADEPSAQPAGRIDALGAALVTGGTGSLVYGLINAGTYGWTTASTLLPIGVAVLLCGLFALRQRTARNPLIDPALLARRSVASGTFLIFVGTALMISVFFLGTFYLQHLHGYGALATGLLFLPVAVGTMIGAQVAGRVIGQLGARPVSVVALAVTALGTAVPALLDGTAAMVAGMSVAAVGLGAVYVGASTTTLADAAHHEAGIASGILSTFHEFGAALGVALTSSLAAASISGTSGQGITRGLTFATATALGAALVAQVALARRPRQTSDRATPTHRET